MSKTNVDKMSKKTIINKDDKELIPTKDGKTMSIYKIKKELEKTVDDFVFGDRLEEFIDFLEDDKDTISNGYVNITCDGNGKHKLLSCHLIEQNIKRMKKCYNKENHNKINRYLKLSSTERANILFLTVDYPFKYAKPNRLFYLVLFFKYNMPIIKFLKVRYIENIKLLILNNKI